MKLTPELERINLSILNGALDLADSDLNRLTANTVAEKRTKAHFQGIVIFHRGEIGRAKQQMESALQQYGENVNLLRDLIACQYHLQDMEGFRANLKRLEALLTEKQDQLSQRSLLECELMVGKFLEEEARLAPSVEFYERALNRAKSYPHRLRALIQKARWVALYEPADQLSELYRDGGLYGYAI